MHPYNGIIDDVQLYNCALNDDDIKQLFDNYKDPLQDNYTIQLDNIKSNLNYCDTTSSNQLIVEADPKDGPYEYSIDNKVWQKAINSSDWVKGNIEFLFEISVPSKILLLTLVFQNF